MFTGHDVLVIVEFIDMMAAASGEVHDFDSRNKNGRVSRTANIVSDILFTRTYPFAFVASCREVTPLPPSCARDTYVLLLLGIRMNSVCFLEKSSPTAVFDLCITVTSKTMKPCRSLCVVHDLHRFSRRSRARTCTMLARAT